MTWYLQNGCRKLAGICKSLNIEGKILTWDTDDDGDWAENTKGVDDYLFSLEKHN